MGVLASSGRHDEHREAAIDVSTSLCIGARSFSELNQTVELPDSGDFRPHADKGWLKITGLYLEGFLSRLDDSGITWPAPGGDPPSIVRDLEEMYEHATVTRFISPRADFARVKRTVSSVQIKACQLETALRRGTGQLNQQERAAVKEIQQRDGGRSKGGRLYWLITIYPLLIAFGQTPSTIVDLGPASQGVVADVVRLSHEAATQIDWIGRSIERAFGARLRPKSDLHNASSVRKWT